MEHERHRPTDDELILSALQRLEASGWEELLTDQEARIIASQWHGGQSSELYSFASTGAINQEALTPEIRLDFDIAIANNAQDDAFALDALARYVHLTGDRPPVEGWHESTRW